MSAKSQMENEKSSPSQVRWQCRRGMLELDLLLFSYFDNVYGTLTDKNKHIFIEFLKATDQDLYRWLIKGDTPPIADYVELIRSIREQKWKE